MLVGTASYPQASQATEPERHPFLSLPVDHQAQWLRGHVQGMAAVLYRYDDQASLCLLRWYAEDPTGRLASVRQSMTDFPDELPSTILVAYALRECGSFGAS